MYHKLIVKYHRMLANVYSFWKLPAKKYLRGEPLDAAWDSWYSFQLVCGNIYHYRRPQCIVLFFLLGCTENMSAYCLRLPSPFVDTATMVHQCKVCLCVWLLTADVLCCATMCVCHACRPGGGHDQKKGSVPAALLIFSDRLHAQ